MVVHRISKTLQNKAIQELNEDPARIDESLQYLRGWLQRQPHLNIRAGDHELLTFLRGSKWSLQLTKAKIDRFYTVRSLIPEFFKNRDPFCPIIQSLLQKGFIYPLPKSEDHDGPRICFFNFSGVDFENTPADYLCKLMFMTLDILLNEDDHLIISGIKIVADYSQLPNTYLLQFTPALLKKSISCLHTVYPIRIKNIIGMNSYPFVAELYNNLIKPFFGSKLKRRIHVCSSNETEKVYNYISKSLLPEQYGGENGSTIELAEQWKTKVESYKDWFVDDEKYFSDEKLRPGKPKTYDEEFGMYIQKISN